MPRVLDLNVPGPLSELFAKYVGIHTGPTGPELAQLLQSKRRVRRRVFRKQRIPAAIRAAALYIQRKAHPNLPLKARQQFISQEIARIRVGIFLPDYWMQLTEFLAYQVESPASNLPDPSPPPYAYRIPENLPSITTYLPGTKTTAPPSQTGSTISARWRDGNWIWTRRLFQLLLCAPKTAQPPTFVTAAGEISVAASTRASRPMFSILATAAFTNHTAYDPDDTDPPARPYISAYWRFRAPKTAPPFYAANITRPLSLATAYQAKKRGTAQAELLDFRAGPRPMFGRGFNNNTGILGTWTPTLAAYQVRPDLGQPPGPPIQVDILRFPPFPATSPSFWTTATVRATWPQAEIEEAIAAIYAAYPPFRWYARTDFPDTIHPFPEGMNSAPYLTPQMPVEFITERRPCEDFSLTIVRPVPPPAPWAPGAIGNAEVRAYYTP